MSLNLVRVAAGVKSLDHLREVVQRYSYEDSDFGPVMPMTTRNRPKRQAELLEGGSIYWIVRGAIVARAALVGFREFTDENGRLAVNMLVRPEVIPTAAREKRGFQGWRYLKGEDAPTDIAHNTGAYVSKSGEDMPAEMYGELKELGLI